MLTKQLNAGSQLAREWALQIPDDTPGEQSSAKLGQSPSK
jgi:hypothetical protein